MKFLKVLKKFKRGTTLVELLGVMVVIAILAAIAIGGISAARDTANVTSVISDMRTYENSIKQVLMLHPEIMKFRVDKTANSTELIIDYMNDQMEEQWKFEPLANNNNGAIATSAMKRDAWGNAYCLYVYLDDMTTTYVNAIGQPLIDNDSCVYIVIASAGKNGTGVGLGVGGINFDTTTKKIADPMACINNTDGVDDIGLIIRVLNGDVYSATFGTSKAVLGELKGVQWVFGKPSTNGGVLLDMLKASPSTIPYTYGGSLDRFYDTTMIPEGTTFVGGPELITTTGVVASPTATNVLGGGDGSGSIGSGVSTGGSTPP